MQRLFSICTLLYLICLSACADTPPATRDNDNKLAIAELNCDDLKLLLDTLKEPNIFRQLPSEFLKNKDSIWKVTKNETSDAKFGLAMQTIALEPRRGAWLRSGSLRYSIEENTTTFSNATFNLNPSCFSKQEDIFAMAVKYFGKHQYIPEPNKKEWLRNSKDQDEWWIISIQANHDGIALEAEITPAPTEESEE